jgi:alanyl-tRNA synthetase
MKKINLIEKYLEFFKAKDHAVLPSAPIVPENDPTCLFNTAGMQPLVPYLLGAFHPSGARLCSCQKCFRLTDLDEVGDAIHHTFFEMLGNWSLGDYFKKESIGYSFEFLTGVLGIPKERLAFTVFQGNEYVGRDSESAGYWKALGVPEERIAYLPAKDNWWPNMETLGPCGSDTEIFYFAHRDEPPKKFDPADKRWVEIWNNVFMQYNHTENGFVELEKKNVDTGMGVERVSAVLSGVRDDYLTETFKPIIDKIEDVSGKKYGGDFIRPMRIIADHIRSVLMIASDYAGIRPSNTDQGYILRRLIRRLYRYARLLEIDINKNFEDALIDAAADIFKSRYPEVSENKEKALAVLREEKSKFAKSLERGLKEFSEVTAGIGAGGTLDGKNAFRLFDTFGFPIEMTVELASEKGIKVDTDGFKLAFTEHQEKSKAGSEQKFKGGLADGGEASAKLHTATHLLHAALRKMFGATVKQSGSNITPERLRFDFSFDRKMTPDEIKTAEDLVNGAINAAVPVVKTVSTFSEATAGGAIGLFADKYGDEVSVYDIKGFSKEICGGPHAANTADLGKFRIIKEEASSSGIRRIKAVLE